MRDDFPGSVISGGLRAPLGGAARAEEQGGGAARRDEQAFGGTASGAARPGARDVGGPTWLLALLCAASIAAFGVLAHLVVDGTRLVELDRDAARWVTGEMPTAVEWLARPVTWLGGLAGVTVVVIVAACWLIRSQSARRAGLLVGVAAGIQVLISVTKDGYDRPRPEVGSAIDLPSSFSFPSGHAAAGVAVFGLVGLLLGTRAHTRAGCAAALGAGFGLGILSGVSRVVLNVHYVSDVLAGWCFGLAWLSACLLAYRVAGR